MQVWLESGTRVTGVDLVGGDDLLVDGNALYIEGKQVGRRVDVSDSAGQGMARSLAGSVEWILLDLGHWKMIPIENIIAACDGGPTKIAARIDSYEQVIGAAFALEIGVDALLVPESILETALIAKSQRKESKVIEEIPVQDDFSLSTVEVIEVKEGGVGDRVCVDLTSMMELGEGMLIGSSASSLILVHGETVASEFVPTRPFRVNAGAVHSYILMGDGSTKYLSELKMGDEVLVVSNDGLSRIATIGRTKIEKRPFILFRWRDEKNKEAGALLQQAETVRLVGATFHTISITSLKPGMELIGWSGGKGRHIGVQISAEVTEK
ncbi:MAG TPA: 3-dehydroquinate synthase II [Candidatus Poseidoniales archaeon]|nr:MAG: 3-dehydroquinate synthase II [Euryarchaeota archaeon]HIF46062.1 3-dehydroquinate synthase II [Candidatus Poseidoniales archaeon]HIL64604.1 3-dehydroquinate synthase II [Candidatus Poseidoniales archaeon]